MEQVGKSTRLLDLEQHLPSDISIVNLLLLGMIIFMSYFFETMQLYDSGLIGTAENDCGIGTLT